MMSHSDSSADVTVSIDPGKDHAGWGIFIDQRLKLAGVVRVQRDRDAHGPYYRQGRIKQVDTQLALRVSKIVAHHVANACAVINPVNVELVVEVPKVYVDEDRKIQDGSNPESLRWLTWTAGVIAGAITHPVRARHVEPAEWKGQRPDGACWQWIRSKLHPDEIEIAIKCGVYDDRMFKTFHHGLEAIGIGAWSLFRL